MNPYTGQFAGRTLAAVLIGLVVGACRGDPGLPERGAALDEVLQIDRRIELERDRDDPIVDASAVTHRSDGGLLVVDQPASRVRRFDDEGNRNGVVGRPGEGPGELRQPSSAVAGPADTLFVVQRGGPRLTAYGPAGAPARAFEVSESDGGRPGASGAIAAVRSSTASQVTAIPFVTGDSASDRVGSRRKRF